MSVRRFLACQFCGENVDTCACFGPFINPEAIVTRLPPVLMRPADPIVCEAVAIQLAKLHGTWAQASMDANRKTAEAVLSALGLAGFNICIDGRS